MNRSEMLTWAHTNDNKMHRLFLFARPGQSRLLDMAIEKIPMWELGQITRRSGKFFA